jgi:hypothetical protein
MLRQTIQSVARCLLVILSLTFAAPGFAWHAHATHEEIAHTSAHHAGAHHHDHDSNAEDHDAQAHTTIGHLLGHLPASLSSGAVMPSIVPAHSDFAEPLSERPHISPDPPFRPPRLS